ncbi:hypothetical protein [Nocardia blacklockiae]|uniref:hypothetical protein n=1 Tax=Nocardia blacklockiae TaxID=480036 RepID=UPI0018941692|nr:hypothetical protein [Nocardia blacklockiae]MBF6176125.1 hypothetical protein [Nocardia blacklockiae]
MRIEPAALIGLDPAQSGKARQLHEKQLVRLAERLGYEAVEPIVVLPMDTARLLDRIREDDVDALIVPSLDHHVDLRTVVPVCDVITMYPEGTYQRREQP